MKDPQEDKTYTCTECNGSCKCPQSRAEIEKLFAESPNDFDAELPLEEYMEDCATCKGEGFIDPDDQEDHFDEEYNDDVRNGFL